MKGAGPDAFRGRAKACFTTDTLQTRDCRYIIAQACNAASSDIWRVPVQGGTPLKLDLSVPKMKYFTLHPDNRRFAFGVSEESKSELWVLQNFLPVARTPAR